MYCVICIRFGKVFMQFSIAIILFTSIILQTYITVEDLRVYIHSFYVLFLTDVSALPRATASTALDRFGIDLND